MVILHVRGSKVRWRGGHWSQAQEVRGSLIARRLPCSLSGVRVLTSAGISYLLFSEYTDMSATKAHLKTEFGGSWSQGQILCSDLVPTYSTLQRNRTGNVDSAGVGGGALNQGQKDLGHAYLPRSRARIPRPRPRASTV